jgi:hypothetical protein
MERVEIMDTRAKRVMAILSFLPILAYVAWAIHFFTIAGQYYDEPIKADRISAALSDNFQSTLLFFTLCFVFTAAVLVYFVVHIARTKMMNANTKLLWIIFMTFGAPIAFPIFWYSEVRNEPERLPVHADIA